MYFYVVCLKHLPREGDGIVYVEILAREDVYVDHTVGRPGMEADVAGGDDYEA
jgi:hypothetical protein